MPEKPINQMLYDAVRQHAARSVGITPTEITIRYEDGSTITVQLPRVCREPARYEVEEQPTPVEGWSFRVGYASWNGTEFRLTGKPLELLQFLARSRTKRATVAEIRSEIWDHLTDDRTISNTISSLRKRLREELGVDDPIILDGDRYLLVI